MDNTNITEASFGQETHNTADGIIPEVLERFGVKSLADVTERDLDAFRYQANIGADSELYKLLLIRRKLAEASIGLETHSNF